MISMFLLTVILLIATKNNIRHQVASPASHTPPAAVGDAGGGFLLHAAAKMEMKEDQSACWKFILSHTFTDL